MTESTGRQDPASQAVPVELETTDMPTEAFSCYRKRVGGFVSSKKDGTHH